MTNQYSYPVLASPDLAEIVATAEALRAIADTSTASTSVKAFPTDGAELSRCVELFEGRIVDMTFAVEFEPEILRGLNDSGIKVGEPWTGRPGFMEIGVPLSEQAAAVLARFPWSAARVCRDECEYGTTEDAFLAAVGDGRGAMAWRLTAWPAVPEIGLAPVYKYVEVSVYLRCSGIDSEPSPDHWVFVGVSGPDGERRAQWLAEQVNLTIIGEPEIT